MSEQESIKQTLDVIRKALEDEDSPNIQEINDNILILNKKVKDDGTIDLIEDTKLSKSETTMILNQKLDQVFEKYLTKWLDKKAPSYLDKYFNNKK